MQAESPAIRDLKTWREFARTERQGRAMHPTAPDVVLHTDAADVGYGGTMGTTDRAGDPGLWWAQGVWSWQDRAESISYQELKALRMMLSNSDQMKHH